MDDTAVEIEESPSGPMSPRDRRNLLLFIAFVVVLIAGVGVVWATSTGSNGDGGDAPTTTVFEYLGRRCPEWQVGLSMGATEDGMRRICMPGGFVWGDR